MQRSLLLLAVVAASIALVVADNSTAFVQTPDGGISGVRNKDGTRQFLGIPFAQPPVGDLRWKAPMSVQPWSKTLDAFFYKPACYQSNNSFTILNTVSEDCLYLNVYAPYEADSKNLPVMLFFYGGSWAEGAASFLLYDGVEDVSYTKDVIIVTANYRLNVFGFLGSPSMQQENAMGTTGNWGLLDQQMAMKWVKKNIAGFGGNPNLVSIWGESAGAGSVSCHLVTPSSAGLFDRAIMESGPIADWTAQPMYAANDKFTEIVKRNGCDGKPGAEMMECMRNVDSKTMFESSRGVPRALSGDLVWSPVVDGAVIPDDPRTLAEAGKFNKVPVLLGTNMDEGTLFLKAAHDVNVTGMYDFLVQLFGTQLASLTMQQYPLSNYSTAHPNHTAWWALSHVFGDSQMSCPARRTARWLSKATGQPVYLYYFSHVLDIIKIVQDVDPKRLLGACHGSELPLVFDFHAALLGKGELPLAEQFVRYWTRFAATGNPNGGSDPNWPSYVESTDMNIDLNLTVSAMSGLKNELCNFWDQHMLPYSAVWKNHSDYVNGAGQWGM